MKYVPCAFPYLYVPRHFRHNIDLLDIYDRATDRDGPSDRLRVAVATLGRDAAAAQRRRASTLLDSAADLATLEAEAAEAAHFRRMEELRRLRDKLRDDGGGRRWTRLPCEAGC